MHSIIRAHINYIVFLQGPIQIEEKGLALQHKCQTLLNKFIPNSKMLDMV